MDWHLTLWLTLQLGLAASALFCVVIMGGAALAPDALLHDYPPAIRERYVALHGGKSARGARVARLMGVGVGLVLTVTPVVTVALLRGRAPEEPGFWAGFTVGFGIFTLINLVDLVLVDWLVFCTLRPAFFTLPGTEGMPEYRDLSFHWKVLVPRPVPVPLLLVPGYGVLVGLGTWLARVWTG
ncbi:hypothetical protein [Streptomyces sp. NPDC005438]|uniref:hypothetical protein n=1 Tax=Streptomyces sp. NPDC005438 TaxID=3156880 RepID=UPI0033A7590C